MKLSLASEKLFKIAVRLHEQNPAHRSNIRRCHKWNHKTISNLLYFPTSVLLIINANGNANIVAPITTSTPRSIEFRKIPLIHHSASPQKALKFQLLFSYTLENKIRKSGMTINIATSNNATVIPTCLTDTNRFTMESPSY